MHNDLARETFAAIRAMLNVNMWMDDEPIPAYAMDRITVARKMIARMEAIIKRHERAAKRIAPSASSRSPKPKPKKRTTRRR